MKVTSALLLIALIALPVSLVLFCSSALAGEAASPSEAKQAFEQMSPEEKQAMKAQAQSKAQEKRDAWQALSEEEKQAKKEQARGQAEARRSNWQHMSSEEKQARRGMARERARQARATHRQ